MSRKVPVCPPAPAITEHYPGKVTSEYDISVITPIVGGGVEPHHNDRLDWLVRPTAVRGHLRFWWRATRGATCTTVAELFEKEGRIWGTTKDRSNRALSSPVEVEITITSSGEPKPWQDFPGAAYVLFAYSKLAGRTLQQDVKFSLTLRYPSDLREDVEAAVWAWTNFGGIGARTRRGCGALFCRNVGVAPPGVSVKNWYDSQRTSRGLAPRPGPGGWPQLIGPPLVHTQACSPSAAWDEAIRVLRDFRQGYGVGRNPARGRSRWPEADSIRAVTGLGASIHRGTITIPFPGSAPAFPRADFGLPIVFHFLNEGLDAELESDGASRMASPLILRPLAFGDGTRALPMVLRLYTRGPTGVRLKWEDPSSKKHEATFAGSSNIFRPNLAAYTNSPLAGRGAWGAALDAFLNFIREPQRGFK